MTVRKKKPMDSFAIVNESTDTQITKDILLKGAAALQTQSERDFAPLWKQTPSTVVVATSEDVESMDVHVTRIVDSIPEAPDALAYHTIDDQGRPLLVIGWNACKSEGGDIWKTLWSAISHEVCEERGNPGVNLNVDMPDGHHDTPREVCDWVQGDLYEIDGIWVSNFVLEAFFQSASPDGTQLDFMKLCTEPLTVRPQGYTVLRSVKDGASRMVFGKEVAEHIIAAKKEAFEEHYSRNLAVRR